MLVSNTSTYTGNLAGVYRGNLINLDQSAAPPQFQHTCSEVDELCADGGCNAGLTQCLTCAPSTTLGVDGKVWQLAVRVENPVNIHVDAIHAPFLRCSAAHSPATTRIQSVSNAAWVLNAPNALLE